MKVNLLETCYVNRTGLSYSYQITKDRVLANIDLEQIPEKIIFLRYFTVEITQENCEDAINAHNSQVFSSQNQSIVVWIGQKLMKSDLNEKFNSTWLKNHRRGNINVCHCLHNGLFYEIEEKDLVVLFPGKLKEMTEKI